MPGTVLGPGNIAVNKIDKISCPHGADISVEGPSPTHDVAGPSSLDRENKGGLPGICAGWHRLKQEEVGPWRQRPGRWSKPEMKRAWAVRPGVSTQRWREVALSELREMDGEGRESFQLGGWWYYGHSRQIYKPGWNYSFSTWFNFSVPRNSYETKEILISDALTDLWRGLRSHTKSS